MAYETSLRPFFVKMTCGHVEIRLMREATARMPWTPEATVVANAQCRVCAFRPDPSKVEDPRIHERDTQCCLDVSDPSVCPSCIVCGVTFGEPCKTCRGRGLHFPGCEPAFSDRVVFVVPMCPKTWNGLHCEKEAGHEPDCAFVPRCEGGA